jgi:cytochrome c oxidase subunit 2
MVLLTAGGLCLAGGCGNTSHQTSNSTPTTASAGGSSVARGRALYQSDGCASCHSLNGIRLTGPSWKGLAGSQVKLSSGRTVTADDAYLAKHITEPNALTVRGYPADVMAQAIETLGLKTKPADVRALVAFIDSLR